MTMLNNIASERLQCLHNNNGEPKRCYSVTQKSGGNFCVLCLCRDCDPIFNAGGQIFLDNGKRMRLAGHGTPIVEEISEDSAPS